MVRYDISISEAAEHDLKEIKRYIAEVLEAPYSAIRIIALLHKGINDLAIYPKAGEIAPEDSLSEMGVRIAHVQKYRVYYGVDEERKAVHIYAILHHLQDDEGRNIV